MRASASATLVFLAALLGACSPAKLVGGPDADGTCGAVDAAVLPTAGLVSISVSPPMQSIAFDLGTPATAVYHATAHYVDGSTLDATAAATWTLDDTALGTIAAGVFTTGTIGGQSAVRASYAGASGTASLQVLVRLSRLEGGAPSGAPAEFAAASSDPSLAPTVVYPYDGVLVPPNLGELEVQWTTGATGDDLFEVAIESPTTDVKVYTTSPKYLLEPDAWRAVAESNTGSNVSVTVAGLVSSAPSAAGASSPLTVRFADSQVGGTIYYFSTDKSGTPSQEGIFRHDFGATGAASPYYTEAMTPSGQCVGCHAVSRDGQQMAVTYCVGCTTPSLMGGVLDIATTTPTLGESAGVQWMFSSFFPDGKTLATSFLGTLSWRDAGTGSAIATVPQPASAFAATDPDVAPDGSAILYAFTPGGGCARFGPQDSTSTGDGIALTPVTGRGTFGAPQVLVPPDPSCGVNHYYPSYSPDGRWILFNESSGNTYNDPTAEIYLMPASGGAPIKLASIDAVGPTNSWPRWSPGTGSYGGKSLYWITFSSQRDYGIELVGTKRAQIWMAAIGAGGEVGSADPSFPPFWMPSQDMTTPNHTAEWAQSPPK